MKRGVRREESIPIVCRFVYLFYGRQFVIAVIAKERKVKGSIVSFSKGKQKGLAESREREIPLLFSDPLSCLCI